MRRSYGAARELIQRAKGGEMNRTYRKLHYTKLKPADKAAADYNNNKAYSNVYSTELERKEYHLAYQELTSMEETKLNT